MSHYSKFVSANLSRDSSLDEAFAKKVVERVLRKAE